MEESISVKESFHAYMALNSFCLLSDWFIFKAFLKLGLCSNNDNASFVEPTCAALAELTLDVTQRTHLLLLNGTSSPWLCHVHDIQK